MKIVSYNIRAVWGHDGINSFAHRIGLIDQVIREEKPDVIGFQEFRDKHLSVMERLMPEYAFYGQFREADYTGEGVYTAVRKDTWQMVGYECFWLSPTPEIAGSRFEIQSQFPRICVMTQLRHKVSGQMMRVYNLHLDHISEPARVEGIRCVLNRVREQNQVLELPCVILGDFNAEPDSETVRLCLDFEGGLLTDLSHEIPRTFHNFDRLTKDCKIDYILTSPTLTARQTETRAWTHSMNGIFLSDHYPVCAQFED